MDLQTMGGKPVTSDNALSHNNLRAHSPQTAGDSRPQPDTPIGLEESWRNANSCARCRSPGCAVPYEDPPTGTETGLGCVRSPFDACGTSEPPRLVASRSQFIRVLYRLLGFGIPSRLGQPVREVVQR